MVMFTPGQRNEGLGILLGDLVVAEEWGEIWRADHDEFGKILLIGYKRDAGRQLLQASRKTLDRWQTLAAAQTPGLLPIHKILSRGKVPLLLVADPGCPNVTEYFRPLNNRQSMAGRMALGAARVLRLARRQGLVPVNLTADTIFFDPDDPEQPVKFAPVSPGVFGTEVQLGDGRYASPHAAPEDRPTRANTDIHALGWIWAELLAGRTDIGRSPDALDRYIGEPRVRRLISHMIEWKDGGHPKPRHVEAAIDEWLMDMAEKDRQSNALPRSSPPAGVPEKTARPASPSASKKAAASAPSGLAGSPAASRSHSGQPENAPPPPEIIPGAIPVGGPPPPEPDPYTPAPKPSGSAARTRPEKPVKPPDAPKTPPAAPPATPAPASADPFSNSTGVVDDSSDDVDDDSRLSPIAKVAVAAAVLVVLAVGGFFGLSAITDSPPDTPRLLTDSQTSGGSDFTARALQSDQPLTGSAAEIPPAASPEDLVIQYEDALYLNDSALVAGLFYFESTPDSVRERLLEEARLFELPLPVTRYEPVIGTRRSFAREIDGVVYIPTIDIHGRLEVKGSERTSQLLIGQREGQFYFAGFVPSDGSASHSTIASATTPPPSGSDSASPPTNTVAPAAPAEPAISSRSNPPAPIRGLSSASGRSISFAPGDPAHELALGDQVRVEGRLLHENFLGYPVINPNFVATNTSSEPRYFQTSIAFFTVDGRLVGGDSKGSLLQPGQKSNMVSLMVELPEDSVDAVASYQTRHYESIRPIASSSGSVSEAASARLNALEQIRTVTGHSIEMENYFDARERNDQRVIDTRPLLRNNSDRTVRVRAHAALLDREGRLLGAVSESATLAPDESVSLRNSVVHLPPEAWEQLARYEFVLYDESGEVGRTAGEIDLARSASAVAGAPAQPGSAAASGPDAPQAVADLADESEAVQPPAGEPSAESSRFQTAAVTAPGQLAEPSGEGQWRDDEGAPADWEDEWNKAIGEEWSEEAWDAESLGEDAAFLAAVFAVLAAYVAFIVILLVLFLYLLPAICFWKIMQKTENPNTWMAWIPGLNFYLVPWAISEKPLKYLLIALGGALLVTINEYVDFLVLTTVLAGAMSGFCMVQMYWAMAVMRGKSGFWGLSIFIFNFCGLPFLPLAYLAFSE